MAASAVSDESASSLSGLAGEASFRTLMRWAAESPHEGGTSPISATSLFSAVLGRGDGLLLALGSGWSVLPATGSNMQIETTTESPYDAVVFSGGGCRCFWQAGFWTSAAAAIGIRPRVVSAVSAGAGMACAGLLGLGEPVLDDFKQRTQRNPRNIYPGNWRPARSTSKAAERAPVFPHESIFSGTLRYILNDELLHRLQAGPEVRIVVTRPPRWLGPKSSVAAGMFAFALDRRELRVHARWGRRFGFAPEVVSVRSCKDSQDLADLILQSSCMPPVVPLYRRSGRIVLDGGLIDNAPIDAVGPAQSTLVLLSRRYDASKLPRIAGRNYQQPSEPIAISNWDYTNPALLQSTFDLGRRDGDRFVREFSSR